MRIIRQGDGELKAIAVRAVGDLRASEAAPVLAKQIDWFDKWAFRLEFTIESAYPCTFALVKIGLPGANAALAEIAASSGDTPAGKYRLKCLALVVLRVYGETLASVVIKDRLSRAKTASERGNYDAALKCLPQIEGW